VLFVDATKPANLVREEFVDFTTLTELNAESVANAIVSQRRLRSHARSRLRLLLNDDGKKWSASKIERRYGKQLVFTVLHIH